MRLLKLKKKLLGMLIKKKKNKKKIYGVSEKKTELYSMFKKYLGVLKCLVCSSDYIPPTKFDSECFFPIPQER